MNILAIIAARNERLHIRRCIENLVNDGIEVALIDHESSDGTREIAERYAGTGIHKIINLKWDGFFSLEKQLIAKQDIINNCKHEWVAHFDADEWPSCPSQFSSLNQMVEAADRDNYSIINFNEYAFVPLPGEKYDFTGYENLMKNYYFFEPSYPRLQRIWRRSCNLSNIDHGGHKLRGDMGLQFPVDGHLRHYIALGEDHAIQKYTERKFAENEVERGWHRNRIIITPSMLSNYFSNKLLHSNRIKTLENYNSKNFDKSAPQKKHFWEWPNR